MIAQLLSRDYDFRTLKLYQKLYEKKYEILNNLTLYNGASYFLCGCVDVYIYYFKCPQNTISVIT